MWISQIKTQIKHKNLDDESNITLSDDNSASIWHYDNVALTDDFTNARRGDKT